MPKHPFVTPGLTALFPLPPSAVSQVPVRTEPTFVASEPSVGSYQLDGGISRSLRPEAFFTCAATPSPASPHPSGVHRFSTLAQNARRSSPRDAVSMANWVSDSPLSRDREAGHAVDLQWPSPDVASFELGAAHTSSNPFDDQRAFELCDRADDDDDSAPSAPPVWIFLAKLRNSMLRWLSSSSTSRKCFTEPARRSQAQTSTMSKRP